jgi:hypothetical protein
LWRSAWEEQEEFIQDLQDNHKLDEVCHTDITLLHTDIDLDPLTQGGYGDTFSFVLLLSPSLVFLSLTPPPLLVL